MRGKLWREIAQKRIVLAVRHIRLDSRDFGINYKIIDNKSDLWVLFLHGWGANKELMESAFGARFKSVNHLYVDLPGFGGSENNFVLDSSHYTQIIKAFLDSLKIAPKIIIAHSFGGKIATLLALESQDSQQNLQLDSQDSPNPKKSAQDSKQDLLQIPALVLLSSAGLQKKQSNKVRLKIKFAKIARIFHLKARFLVSADAKDLSQNMYESFKLVVREDFTQKFAELQSKTLIFWGKNDEALPLYLGEKMKDLIKNSRFFAMQGNHFFFLDSQNAESIEKITTKELGF